MIATVGTGDRLCVHSAPTQHPHHQIRSSIGSKDVFASAVRWDQRRLGYHVQACPDIEIDAREGAGRPAVQRPPPPGSEESQSVNKPLKTFRGALLNQVNRRPGPGARRRGTQRRVHRHPRTTVQPGRCASWPQPMPPRRPGKNQNAAVSKTDRHVCQT